MKCLRHPNILKHGPSFLGGFWLSFLELTQLGTAWLPVVDACILRSAATWTGNVNKASLAMDLLVPKECTGPGLTATCHCTAAQPPNPSGACLGKIVPGPEWDRIASEAARTIPGRENGGNCDIKNLTRGSKVPCDAVVLECNPFWFFGSICRSQSARSDSVHQLHSSCHQKNAFGLPPT